jgi:ribonuclease HI
VQPDDRGEEIVDWMIANDLEPMNDPNEATRIDRHSGNESSPDITFCGEQIASKCEWEVSEPIGNSDHLPIITTIQVKVPHQLFLGAASRWRRNGVDWSLFTESTEDVFSKMKPLKRLKERVTRFVKTLTDAAKDTVGRTKPGKRTKPWMTSDVKGLIKTRNRLRRKIRSKRVEWKAACRAVNEAIERAKEESWKDVLADVITDADETKLWGIVKSLNGSPASNARNEAMIHKGKTITSDKRKADIFQQHYASVSRLKFTKSERSVNRRLKKILRSREEGPVESSCREFSMFELDQAIQLMRKKGAAGPDDIPPTFLKALGPHGKQELLDIINQSWTTGDCPQAWLNAIIIPLLKAKKPASELSSYRPISLTSCIAKVMERMVANRLYHLAETNGWIHPSQAGFRKGRSCEDHITRTVQRIGDGFNAKPMQRSVMVLLDFSKAYDTVWRERLLLALAEKGVPLPIIRWLRSFLSNRQARVRFNGVLSAWMTMRQGLPQGSVLAPLLFLFYINTLAEILPTNVINSLFADDVEILATADARNAAQANAQRAVDIVTKWSREWKLNLNAAKSEVAYFTNWTGESSWRPEIFIDGKSIEYSPTPRLLGVTLDRYLTFGQHVDNVCKSATSSCRILSALSHSKWGWRKQYLVKIYHSVVKSKLGYSGAAWQGNIAECHIQSLERTQNRALRLITGQFKDTPLEALRAEAGVPSYRTHMERNLLISREKALRLDADHPRRRAFDESIPKRIGLANDTKHSWRSKTDQLMAKHGLEEILSTSREPLSYFELAPWLDGNLERVYPYVPGLESKNEPELIRRTLSYTRIREMDSTYVLYSDGSASGGVEQGGAGVVVTFGDPEFPTVVDTLMRRGSPLTCSYNEEYTAMHLAMDWIEEHCATDSRVTVVTDSKSLCDALLGYGHETKDLRRRLIETVADVSIQWVPGHSGIEGNELADAAAKQATSLQQEPTAITLGSACARIRATIKDDLSTHERSARVYSKISKQKEAEVRSREDQVLLGQIRAAHHWCFESYHQLVDETHNTTCKECGWEMHDLEHWLCHCPSTSHIRMRTFGTLDVGLEVLTDTPIPALAFTREALGYTRSNAPDVPLPQ